MKRKILFGSFALLIGATSLTFSLAANEGNSPCMLILEAPLPPCPPGELCQEVPKQKPVIPGSEEHRQLMQEGFRPVGIQCSGNK